MANDRLYLKCGQCGQVILLFKYYPGGNGYVYKHVREYEQWIEEHLHDLNCAQSLKDHEGFRVVIESQD